MSQIKQMLHNSDAAIQIKQFKYSPELTKGLFEKVKDKEWSMLLDSNNSQHNDSRFDILVASPTTTVVTKGKNTKISDGFKTVETQENPFSVINDLLAQFASESIPSFVSELEIPFIGGAVGLWGYDLGRQIEHIPNLAIDELHTPDLAIGIYNWAFIVDHALKRAYLVGNNIEKAQHLLFENQNQSQTPFRLTSAWQSNLTFASYQQRFNQIQEYLLAGDCYQINLAQRFEVNYEGSEWEAFNLINGANCAPFSAFITLPESRILSVSPERFIKLDSRKIETKPIKGTRPRGRDDEQENQFIKSLQNSEKDRAENLMIVDLLRNDIGRVAQAGSVCVPKLFDVETFPAVHHLVSTIHAQLNEKYSAVDLLKASFPGGSITGAPKIRAMQIIEELEPHRRNAYCGSIGYISRHGQMDTSITIRTLVAERGKLYAWAGGGIVADSDCEEEYQETLDKLSKILPILSHTM